MSFDDEVRKYIPELPDYGALLAIDNPMHHTSGLRAYAGLLALAGHSPEEVTTDAQPRPDRAPAPPQLPERNTISYSDTLYFLLSGVVERLIGCP